VVRTRSIILSLGYF